MGSECSAPSSSLRKAISAQASRWNHLSNGKTLALGGTTLYRRPVAFVRALWQREPPPRGLTLVAEVLAALDEPVERRYVDYFNC